MSGFMNPSRGSGWDRRDLQTSNFRWDYVSNLSQSNWVWITKVFQELLFWILVYCHCDLVRPFLQSAIRQCYFGWMWVQQIIPWEFCTGRGLPSLTLLHQCACVVLCLNILPHYLTCGGFTRIPPVFTHHCDALHNLVPFALFKKRDKHPWRSVTFSRLKVTLLHGCFHIF